MIDYDSFADLTSPAKVGWTRRLEFVKDDIIPIVTLSNTTAIIRPTSGHSSSAPDTMTAATSYVNQYVVDLKKESIQKSTLESSIFTPLEPHPALQSVARCGSTTT